MLAFTSVYFSESGLFNGLRPIQTKNYLAFERILIVIFGARRALRFRGRAVGRIPADEASSEDYIGNFSFRQENAVIDFSVVGLSSPRYPRRLLCLARFNEGPTGALNIIGSPVFAPRPLFPSGSRSPSACRESSRLYASGPSSIEIFSAPR